MVCLLTSNFRFFFLIPPFPSRRSLQSFLTCHFDVPGRRVLPSNDSLNSSRGDFHFRGYFRYLPRRGFYIISIIFPSPFTFLFLFYRSDFYEIVFSFLQLVRNKRGKFCDCLNLLKRDLIKGSLFFPIFFFRDRYDLLIIFNNWEIFS